MAEIKGDLTVKRSGIFDRRADQGMASNALLAPLVLTRHSAWWQKIASADAAYDITLPDATTLPNGWTVVVHNESAEVMTVEDDTSGATLATVSENEAKKFTLTDNGDADGEWWVENIASPGEVPAQRYTDIHSAAVEAAGWGAAGGGYHSRVITAATHGRGTRPTAQFFETSGADEISVTPDQVKFATATGDVTFRVTEDPDLKYAGKVILI